MKVEPPYKVLTNLEGSLRSVENSEKLSRPTENNYETKDSFLKNLEGFLSESELEE